MMMMVKEKRTYSYEILLSNTCESLLPRLAHKTFGKRDKDSKFYSGNKGAKIKENNIIVGDKEYAGTPGLWDLIVATTR